MNCKYASVLGFLADYLPGNGVSGRYLRSHHRDCLLSSVHIHPYSVLQSLSHWPVWGQWGFQAHRRLHRSKLASPLPIPLVAKISMQDYDFWPLEVERCLVNFASLYHLDTKLAAKKETLEWMIGCGHVSQSVQIALLHVCSVRISLIASLVSTKSEGIFDLCISIKGLVEV